jgi:hypothetical protein
MPAPSPGSKFNRQGGSNLDRRQQATLIDCKLHDRFAGQFRWDEQDGGKPQFKRVAHLVMPGPFALLLTARRFDPVQR